MRMPRFRLRTLLILVVLAGVGVGGYVLWGRSVEYAQKAEQYRIMGGVAHSPVAAQRRYRVADHYRRAARYPWLTVAPDPPEPE